MGRTNYQRGYEIERKIVHELTSQGYLVLRSAGSHSKVDVLGISRRRILAVQSKRTKKFSPANYRKEIADIQATIAQHNLDDVIDFELWVWVDRQGFRKWQVRASHVKEVA
ncbi:Holliday junction resolvase [Heliobacterium undosum]|uniref:Holliday junction resolvase n=1 Tax=Heliomicrobium undosum TaxID=121734 RepID=A0A845L1J5_9FIRM|nr:Holliday junction resolvase [Heliomicrobium undosum]MZP28664.1 Holliday junction resolvase [Heliomicrobium undosum]